MIFDSLDVSYGEMWGSYRGMTHRSPMSRALAARKHAAGKDYAVLLSAREQPLALVEYWPGRMWRVYLFDDRSWCMQMIDLEPHGTGLLLAQRNTRWQFPNDQAHLYGKWDVQETTTVSADGHIEVKSEFAGLRGGSPESSHAGAHGPSSVSGRRLAMPVEDFLCPAPEFGDWQVFAPLLTQQGHESASTIVLNDRSVDEGSGPLRATGIEHLFNPGACETREGPGVVEPIDAGVLRITSGRLAVSDPGWTSNLRTVTVPLGRFLQIIGSLVDACR